MIQTKVARIDSDTRLILAAGRDKGVKEGMTFVIYELGDEIFDPETSRSLGRIEHIKGRVTVDHVQDHLCIARTKIYERSDSMSDFAKYYGRLLHLEQEKLKVESPQPLSKPSELAIRIGDLARSLE